MQAHEQLEQRWADATGLDNTVACSSGTSALHLALEAFRLPPGSEVLVPEFTMVACARAVVMAGLKPVFVDCDDSLLMEVEDCSRQITPTTRAIMPVHVYGRRCDMAGISSLAEDHDLIVVEDCAEFHGASLSGLADAYCWSFYKNKIVAGEEGGMIAFTDGRPADLTRMLRTQGFTLAHNFLHLPRGVNARMSNSHAELILDSLKDMDDNLLTRETIATWYDACFPDAWLMPEREVVWVYDLRIREVGGCVDRIVNELNRRGVPARMSFKPMSEQPEFRATVPHHRIANLNALKMSRRVFYLPVDPEMTRDEVERIATIVRQVVGC